MLKCDNIYYTPRKACKNRAKCNINMKEFSVFIFPQAFNLYFELYIHL